MPSGTLPQVRVFLLLPAVWLAVLKTASTFITGIPAICSNEGERVDSPLIADHPCISCLCKNREVVCKKQACNVTQNCYLVLYEEQRNCCDVCKGCTFRGKEYRSGHEWTDPIDPCQTFSCRAGVVTASRLQCYTPCRNPIPPETGTCCPSCKGCFFNDIRYKEGDKVQMDGDRCVQCNCKNGNIVCEKQACPVLACPESKFILKPGSCCPECNGTRKVYPLKDKCLLRTKIYKQGQKFIIDECTRCECKGSTSVCEREVCPPILCPAEYRKAVPGQCCPECQREEIQRQCISGGHEYKDGDTWRLDPCTKCACQSGEVHCYVEQCSITNTCPERYRLQKRPGECCPECIEDDAVCTVFGDPHYKSFDGKMFNFQGSCKYVLTEDCVGKNFSVRVRNDGRDTRSFSWTKTVFFQIGTTKVTLEQKMNAKVNKKEVQLPYQEPDILTITKEGYSVMVSTYLGVKLLWDGDSFLEVSMPPSYKNRLCGLCGNYNDNEKDDFKTRKGKVVNDPYDFGSSWRVGGVKRCTRSETVAVREPLCQNKWDVRIKGIKKCNNMKSTIFKSCHKKVNPVRYFKSCLLDMCECPPGLNCYCEALTAYAHECARAGIFLEWRNATRCGGVLCPKGAIYDPCGPACKKTCSNWKNPGQCMKPCVAGCQCPAGTVWHRNRCIKKERCPRR